MKKITYLRSEYHKAIRLLQKECLENGSGERHLALYKYLVSLTRKIEKEEQRIVDARPYNLAYRGIAACLSLLLVSLTLWHLMDINPSSPSLPWKMTGNLSEERSKGVSAPAPAILPEDNASPSLSQSLFHLPLGGKARFAGRDGEVVTEVNFIESPPGSRGRYVEFFDLKTRQIYREEAMNNE